MTDAELLIQIEASIAAHPGVNTVQEDGVRVEYGDLNTLIQQRNSLNAKIAAAAGTYSRRVYAKNGGRGV